MLKLCNFTLINLAEFIHARNLQIVVYGAGMIGTIVVPDFLERNGLLNQLCCYIDADERKCGSDILIAGKSYNISSPFLLNSIDRHSIILITNSNYEPVINMLDSIENIDGMDAAIIPVLQTLELNSPVEKYVYKDYSFEAIPKVINYCWFSGKAMPDYLKKCIESWHRYCPDYEIKRWDENNYDVTKNHYMKDAYEQEKWGFVPDYSRLDILYNYGGFYIDTDVELIRSLELLRYQGAFCGVEKWGNINMGGCSGAVAHHPMIKAMLDYRENIPFKYDDGSLNLNTCGVYETAPFIQAGMCVDNSTQRINNMTVFASDFFHPYDYMSGQTIITENTISIHHFNGGWLDEKARQVREKTAKKYQCILKRMGV